MNKLVKPNQLEVAKKQMSKFLKAGIKLPESIREDEKKLYHAAIITNTKLNKETLEVTCDANLQKFDDRSWEKHKKNLAQLGLSDVFIFHNPTLPMEEEEEDETGQGIEEDKEPETEEEETELSRKELIEKAVSLGFTGAKNLKNEIYEDFIERVERELKIGGEK